jgi:hypothetical protein
MTRAAAVASNPITTRSISASAWSPGSAAISAMASSVDISPSATVSAGRGDAAASLAPQVERAGDIRAK